MTYRSIPHLSLVVCLCMLLMTSDGNAKGTSIQSSLGPPKWTYQVEGVSSQFPSGQWWEKLGSEKLNALIIRALDHNQTLEIATARLEQSRQLARISLGREIPDISMGSNFTRQRNSENLLTPQIKNLSGSGPKLFTPGAIFNLYNIPLTANYELDYLFKNRKKTKAMKEEQAASLWTLKATTLSISAAVAQAYLNFCTSESILKLQEKQEKKRLELLHIEKLKLERGLTTPVTVNALSDRLEQNKQKISETKRLSALYQNQLALLLGATPSEIQILAPDEASNILIPQIVHAGLPSELLYRRPDIMAAEHRLKALTLNVEVARREFFPSINLSGLYSLASTDFSSLFDWESRLFGMSASAMQKLFTGGEIKANLRAKKALYKEGIAQYREVALIGFKEVEDALVSLQQHQRAFVASETEKSNKRETYYIQDRAFKAGVIALPTLYEAEISSLTSQQQVVNRRLALITDHINLYKALGGGY